MRKKGEEGMSESNHPEAQIIGALKQVKDERWKTCTGRRGIDAHVIRSGKRIAVPWA